MIDNGIINILACKAEDVIGSVIDKDGRTIFVYYKDILAIISRQRAKIEALQMDNEQLQSDIINANMNLEHMTAEIERLNGDYSTAVETMSESIRKANAEVDRLSQVVLYHDGHIADARAEATEQLSKKIESRLANNTDISNEQYQSIIWDISEACKEMVW